MSRVWPAAVKVIKMGWRRTTGIWTLARQICRCLAAWWRRQDRHYRWKWRATILFAAVLLLAGAFIPIAEDLWQHDRYALSAEALQLVGTTDQTLLKQLTYDSQTATYRFNQAALQSYDPTAALKNQIGTASGQGGDKSLYALDVPADMSQGVTYTDTNSQLSFSLVPQFSAMNGRAEQGHLVFPLAGDTQAVYTLKNNGLKEDIVVEKATHDSMAFTYKLQLPKTLAVKEIPDSGGAIGIYGPDPALLSNMSYDSDGDQALVEKARENADKTNLIFGLPAPIIKTASGRQDGTAHFELHGNMLTVAAEHLSGIRGAFTIDPSVVVTSASDFQNGGNNDGMINFDTVNNQVSRGGLTGGSVSSGWNSTSSLILARYNGGVTEYNGYIYVLGGAYPANNEVEYTPVNSNGTLGTWQTTSSFTTARFRTRAVAYAGYVYIIGGSDASNDYLGDVQYARVNSDGSLGSWQTTTSLSVPRSNFGATAYGGYLYVMGGNSSGGLLGDVQYAPINANGTLGTWQTTSSFNTARQMMVVDAYSNNLYIIGGSDGTNNLGDVQYAPINANGTLGTWQTTSSFNTARTLPGTAVYNGYIYIMGGSGGAYYSDVQYAPINANGTLGTWQTTTSFATARDSVGAVAYNGYLYILGGSNGGGTSFADVQYAKIDPAGINGSFTTSGDTVLSNARSYADSVAYDGYIYVLGGSSTVSDGSTGYSTVTYAPVNADGTVGSWTTGTTFVGGNVHNDAAAVAYNGYLYLLAGNGTTTYNTEVQYAPINSDGSVGTWADTTALALGRSGASAWAYNGYMYLAGGYHSSNDKACNTARSRYCSDVWKATINSDGTLGSWTAENSTPAGLYDAAVAQWGNYVYILGGDGGSCTQVFAASLAAVSGAISSWNTLSPMSTCRTSAMAGVWNGYLYVWGNTAASSPNIQTGQYFKVQNDGSQAADSGCGSLWCSTSSMTSSTLGYRTGFIYRGTMYAMGGATTAAASTAVETSIINNGGNGTTNTWVSTTGFTTARTSFGAVAYNGYLYIVGGFAGGSLNDVQYAPINANGTIGTWTTTTSLTSARYGLSAVADNGYLYIMGGNGSLNDVQYAPINANGTIGAWQTTTSLISPREYFSATTYNGYLYVMGGYSGSSLLNDVQYAPINANGTLGAWTATTSFSTARDYFAAVAYGGYMYVMGGTSTNDVQYAPINANGTLGAWQTTANFITARVGPSALAYNGYLYLVGGQTSGGTSLNDVQYAPINANGTLGAWQTTANFITGRDVFSAIAYNGYVYIMGGYNGSYLSDVQDAQMNTIARVGHYSKLIDLGAAANVTGITYNGTLPGGAAAITYRAAGSSGVFGALAAGNTISGSGGCLGTTTNTQYLLVIITLDDSYGQDTGSVFPDSAGVNANVTDFTVTYTPVHPPPQIRLRAGQTFQQGNLSALDTCRP